ncbi:exopolyphosphatase/guanosine-5'-triphosphate,3'-diphosphate pyrophosphatase [Isoptericola sp. CG 20/1183]|uniref:Exopolyphosphatase/guanosine-5'-triphosphate, 3'-diphosphate pyrophosphatase n=1 Tax=Isoptericola halotolerans TaxID=300560 RepID=A0ABX5EFI4_9MICO|nr:MULTISPECIES: Ppx/GppA phosphatase family protein [Isoptericola]PRZ06443.1 exopolyphosphatase/guanosine-5'-triphosphate,3'-diphosphate pyrophosphatase [Isoptericola halotolerans]PRZ06751.1 exopolyphosphatase/guanosine-5'-triphosphate,3'-diphosphate pyrophosphatase [Isoptericola sp. CG 20/1183]
MSSSTRVAAVDCGTNSIRLLVADVSDDGTLTELDRRMEIVRLGQGVDRTGELAPEALERTLAASREYAKVAAEMGATRVRFVATSATRDARNRADFAAGVRAALGVDPEVVSGEEEALLSFRGATSGSASEHPGPYLVVDLGGGSTELVLGSTTPDAAVSMDVGSVRLTERHLHSDPPAAAEISRARADVTSALDAASAVVPLGRTATLVGLAGSVTSVTAHALGLTSYRRETINGAVLSVDDVLAACEDLLGRTREERLALGFMHPGRADVIGAGALVWSQVVTRVRDEVAASGGALTHVVTSESDILDGIALSLA